MHRFERQKREAVEEEEDEEEKGWKRGSTIFTLFLTMYFRTARAAFHGNCQYYSISCIVVVMLSAFHGRSKWRRIIHINSLPWARRCNCKGDEDAAVEYRNYAHWRRKGRTGKENRRFSASLRTEEDDGGEGKEERSWRGRRRISDADLVGKLRGSACFLRGFVEEDRRSEKFCAHRSTEKEDFIRNKGLCFRHESSLCFWPPGFVITFLSLLVFRY